MDGSATIRSGVYEALSRAGVLSHDAPTTPSLTFPNVPQPGCWLAGTNSVIFSTPTGDTRNLWETEISPRSGRVSGTFKRLTAGSGDEVDPSCLSGDVLTFTNVEAKSGIWSLPFDFGEGRPTGPLAAITPGPSGREPAVSKDGRFMAFVSAQSGPLNVWLRNLETGKESHLASSASAQRYPLANSTGSKVAFSAFEAASRSVYLWSVDGTMEKLCDVCERRIGQAMRRDSWSMREVRIRSTLWMSLRISELQS